MPETAPGAGQEATQPASPDSVAASRPAPLPLARRRHIPSLHLPHVRPVRVGVRLHTFDSFSYRNYRLLWGAAVGSGGGIWLQQIVVGWLAYDITRSAFLTSLILGLEAFPLLLAGPLGGVLVDVWDRRKLLASVFAYQGLVALGFSVLVILDLVATWHLFVFVPMMGLAFVIIEPARMAIIPRIVPRENLVNAYALTSLAFSGTRLAIPAVGGVMIALLGPGPTLVTQGLMHLSAMGLALMLNFERQPRDGFKLRSAFSGMREALIYVKSDPLLLGLLLLLVVPATLVMPFVSGLMPVLAAEEFGVGPTGLGILVSAVGAGGTVGTLALASVGDIRRKGVFILSAIFLAAVAMAALSQSRLFGLAVPSIFVLSIGLWGAMALINVSIVSIVRDEFRGRVGGLFVLAWGFSPLGYLVAGVLAQRLGAPNAILIAGGAVSIIAVVLVLRFRALWQFRETYL